MKNNPILSFLLSLTVATVIVGLICICYLFLTFNLAGGETLSQIENQNIVQLIISILLLTFAIFYARHYFNKSKKYTAYGIVVLPLALVFATAFYFFEQNFYYVTFDKKTWEQSEWKPEKMAKTLVKEKTLIGLSRTQVKEMLGEGSEEFGDVTTDRGSLLYLVMNDWTLIVLFQKNKVVETNLRLPYLGI